MDGPLKILVGHLPVMLVRHRSGVTKEGSRNITGMLAGQFSCPAGPQVLEELGPGCESGTFQDSRELCPQAGVWGTVQCDDILFMALRLVPCLIKNL